MGNIRINLDKANITSEVSDMKNNTADNFIERLSGKYLAEYKSELAQIEADGFLTYSQKMREIESLNAEYEIMASDMPSNAKARRLQEVEQKYSGKRLKELSARGLITERDIADSLKLDGDKPSAIEYGNGGSGSGAGINADYASPIASALLSGTPASSVLAVSTPELPRKRETEDWKTIDRVFFPFFKFIDESYKFLKKHKKGVAAAGTVAIGTGVVADLTLNDAKYTKNLRTIFGDLGKSFGALIPTVDSFAPHQTPNVPVINETVKATPQVRETPAQHQFTPDLKVFGSPEYKQRVQDALNELNKTPDSFRINGMTAYQYATYYLDELHEGDKEKIIEDGKEQYPINYISASNLIHIPRHIEQGHNNTFLADLRKWENKGEDGGLFAEYDAIKLQVAWEKARYNLTDEQKKNSFLSKMKYYTNDSKYFEDELMKN